MLWAACTTCFFGFLRSGEIVTPSQKEYDPGVHLSYGDVTVDNPADSHVVQVNIKASKTDPIRKGVSIFLGRTDMALCPVAAITAYLAIRGGDSRPVLQIPKWTHIVQREVRDQSERGTAAGWERPKQICRSQLPYRGCDNSCSTGCRGFIKTLGSWQSSAYLLYVRIPIGSA